ncbi:MAG: type II secretion system protein GspE, partial [bacterium]|nr:type II secretion system protein GspE [bacterium]
INMGVEPFLISSTINCIVSQRLVRRICSNCKTPDIKTDEDYIRLGFKPEDFKGHTLMKGRGCEKCGNTGYKGMVGLFEVMEMSGELRKAIMKKLPTDDIEAIAVQNGMATLRQIAIRKMNQGVIDIIEAVKETGLR